MLTDTLSQTKLDQIGVGTSRTAINAALNQIAWAFFHNNTNLTVLSIHKWFFSFTIKLSELRPLFVTLFGPEGVAV